MVKCQSCGAENAPGRARCEYCDAALEATRHLDVQWNARSREGVAGRGKLVVVAGGADATGERARTAVEAAFSAAVDAGGAQAKAEQIEAAMRQRLPALLPPGWTIESFTLEALSAPVPGQALPGQARGPGAPVPASSGCKVPAFLVLLFLTFSSSCCALGAFLAGGQAAERAGKLSKAQVMTPAQAAAATGPVCVEAHTAQVESALVLGELRALTIVTTRAKMRTVTRRDSKGNTTTRQERGPEQTSTQSVDGFKLGPLRVVVGQETEFTPLTPLDEEEEDELGGRVRRSVFRADAPITVAGPVERGVMQAQEITSLATRAELLDKLQSDARGGRGAGVVFAVFALLFLLGTVAALLKRK